MLSIIDQINKRIEELEQYEKQSWLAYEKADSDTRQMAYIMFIQDKGRRQEAQNIRNMIQSQVK